MKTIDIFGGLFFTLFGLFWIIFYKRLSKFAVYRWRKVFPNIKISEKVYKIPFLLGGIFFTIVGILTLLQVI
jgi:hypothetical protein